MSRYRDDVKPVAAYTARLKNRRIRAWLMKDGTIWYSFKRLTSDRTVHTDNIRVSMEALETMVALMIRLKSEGQQ